MDTICCCLVVSHVRLFVTPWTGAHQTPLSMGFSRQEPWSQLPFPPPGSIFLTQGLSPCLLHWQAGSLPLNHQGSPMNTIYSFIFCFSCPLRVNILFIQNEYIMKENQIDRIVCILKIPPVVPWWPLPFALVHDLLFSNSTAFSISAHTSKTRGFYNPLVFGTEYTVYQCDLLYQYFCSQYICLFHSRELDSVLMCSRDKIILSNCCVLKQSRGFTSPK